MAKSQHRADSTVKPMGKAARNERLRLTASFYNSLAVGLALGGVALPYITALTNPPFGLLNFVIDETGAQIHIGEGLTPTIGIVIALGAAWLCRRRAMRLAAQIED